MEQLRVIYDALIQLNQRQRLIVASMVVLSVLLAVLGLSLIRSPEFLPIYKNLSQIEAARIESGLSSAGIDVQMSEDGSSISVERHLLARARMIVAETGIPVSGDLGWELFDDQSGLAMNSFLQRINRLRALEGELARSVQTLDGIQSARVHLVLPERVAFTREQPEPRASVVVRALGGRSISKKQAIAIRNLVGSAVAQLELNRVTVLSASGELILSEDSTGIGQATLQSSRSSIEDRLALEVQNILSARVGAGNARVRVNVELSPVKETIIQQSFDPDQQIVRSSETKIDERTGSEGLGNVGVENNLPTDLTQDAGSGSSTQQTKSGEIVNYEIGNTRHEFVKEAGEISKISVAVMVNGIFTVEGSEVTYSERTSEELERLSELVRAAVGFSSERGDTVSIDSFRFMDYSMELGEPITLSLYQQFSRSIGTILRSLIALALVSVVMLFGIRPGLNILAQRQNAIASPQDNVTATSLGQVSSDDIADANFAHQVDGSGNGQDTINTRGVNGELQKKQLDSIQSLAENKPDEAIRVMRAWLASEAVS